MTTLLKPLVDQILSKTDRDDPQQNTSQGRTCAADQNASNAKTFFKRLSETGEGEMARNRLVISGLILIYFIGEVTLNDRALTLPLIVISSFFLFSSALAFHIIASPAANYHRRILALCGDIGTLSVGLFIGGEVTASTFPIYLWIIFGNGFRFGLLFLSLSSIAATLCFAVVILTTSYWQSFYNLSFGLLLALVILPLYARKLIRDLSEARKKAETASEMKSLFLASVSHELRTPLNAVIGLSDLLSSTKLNDEQREMSTSINASGRSLCGLIDNFLDYSRLEAGAMPFNNDPFCLVSLMTELNCIARAQAGEKGLIIGLYVTPRTPKRFVGDRGKLAQILTNLIGNAVKFTEQGSVSLGVDTLRNDGRTARLRFEVTDTGIGISTQSQKTIFERFTQANARIVDQFGGTGLGLAIVQELTELLGGEIGVTSTPGVGSTFWCEFDMALDHDLQEHAPVADLHVAIYSDTAEDLAAHTAKNGCKDTTILKGKAQLASWLECHHKTSTGSVLLVDETLHDPELIGSFAGHSTNVKVICISHSDEMGLPDTTLKATVFSRVRHQALSVELNDMMDWLAYHRAIRQERKTLMTPTHGADALTILVAEDNHANQMVVSKILNHAGHLPVIASDGEEALQALARNDFDVILLDLNMPRMNGFETLKFMHFALHEQDIPIIALTADASPDTSKKCLNAGFDSCITKPYNPNVLLQTIQSFTVQSPTRAGQTEDLDEVQKSKEQSDVSTHVAQVKMDNVDEPSPPHAIDPDRVEMIANLGDAKFFNQLINEFDSEAAEILSGLRAATDARDLEKIRLLAHALKSSAVNFGATKLVQKCERLEYGDRHDVLHSASDVIADISNDYKDVRSALIALAMSQHLPECGPKSHTSH